MHHVRLVKAGEINRATAFTDVNVRCLRDRIQQLMGRMGGKNGGAVMVARCTTHSVVIGINRVETRIAVPGFIEMNAIAGLG